MHGARRARRVGAGVPIQADPRHRAGAAGQRAGFPLAPARAEAGRYVGAAARHRQRAGCRRQHRHRSRRQGAARWLHAALQYDRADRREHQHVFQSFVRPGEGFRADHAGGEGAEHPGGASQRAGEERAGADQLRQGESRQAALRLAGQRHLESPVGGAAQADGGHRSPAHPLQVERADDHRHPRRSRSKWCSTTRRCCCRT